MMELTEKQERVLEFSKTYISDNQNCPTIRTVAGLMEVSLKAAHDYIKALERKGFIVRDVDGGRFRLTGYEVKLKKIKSVH